MPEILTVIEIQVLHRDLAAATMHIQVHLQTRLELMQDLLLLSLAMGEYIESTGRKLLGTRDEVDMVEGKEASSRAERRE